MKKGLRRFARYAGFGGFTFAFDLILLFVFTDVFGWNYALSAAVAFLFAVSINYLVVRNLVFPGSNRRISQTYPTFIAIALVGMSIVTGLIIIFVEYFGWHYLMARIVIAAIVGIWNYSMNLFFNFRVAGKHKEDGFFNNRDVRQNQHDRQ